MLQVTGAKDSTVRKIEDTNKERVIIGSYECLLSTSDEGSEGLEKFLRDELEPLSGEVLERSVEVDPIVVLELVDENVVDRDRTGSNVKPVGNEIRKSSVDDVSRSELKEKRLGIVSKRPLCDVDSDVAGEHPSKSVAFQFDDASARLSSAGCELVGVSDAGQSFPSSSRSDDTD